MYNIFKHIYELSATPFCSYLSPLLLTVPHLLLSSAAAQLSLAKVQKSKNFMHGWTSSEREGVREREWVWVCVCVTVDYV